MTLQTGRLPRLSRRDLDAYIYPLLLVALAFLVFREGSTHKFTNWDDWKYIVENPLVQGLSPGRIWTAFTQFHVFNYNPLHIISYMVDYEMWGLRGGGFFLTSLALHMLAGLFFYFFSLRLLGSGVAAYLCAGVFLVHPTRIESVAWLSERKDVLSAFFAAAALLVQQAWLVRRSPGGAPGPAVLEPSTPGAGRGRDLAWAPAASWCLFLLALLSKSQLVTLPIVLVALDLLYRRPLRESILSKIPFFVLSAVFSLLTLSAHADEGSRGVQFPESLLVPLAALPRYVLHVIWPVGLSPYYDYASTSFDSAGHVAAGIVLLGVLAWSAWRSYQGKRIGFFAIVWFLAFLAPVIGLVRINILLADRYLYIAILGPALALAKTILDVPAARIPALAASVVAVACMAGVSASYLPTFHDTETLWTRALEICPGASMAHSNLGAFLRSQGRIDEAAAQYDADLAEKPYFEESFLGRAAIHEGNGEKEAARALYERLIEKRPRSAPARIEYADFLERSGEVETGLRVLLDLSPLPSNAFYHCKLADIYEKLHRPADALAAVRTAAAIDPYDSILQARLLAAEAKQSTAPEAGAARS